MKSQSSKFSLFGISTSLLELCGEFYSTGNGFRGRRKERKFVENNHHKNTFKETNTLREIIKNTFKETNTLKEIIKKNTFKETNTLKEFCEKNFAKVLNFSKLAGD